MGISLFVFAQNEDQYTSNERILRIRQLGKRGTTALPALAQYLSDRSRDIRLEAVKSIVKIDTEQSLDGLVQASRDKDSEIQIRAADGMVNAYVAGYVVRNSLSGYVTKGVRQIKSFFSSRNDQVVDPDVVIRPEVAQALGDQITSGSGADVRSNAALAAGILRARPAVPALEKGLHARDNDTIFECLVALQKIQDPAAGPEVSFLTRDLDDRIQSTALETIGVLRSLSSAADVRYALTHARNARVRRAALESLAMLGLPEDRPIFQQYLGNSDAELRAAALEGLGRTREPEDYKAIESAYNEANADWRVHLAAAFALVNEGKVSTDNFSPLSYLVEGLNIKARAYVANAYLTELAKRDDVRRTLPKLLAEATKDQKIAICGILGSTQNEDTIPPLEGLSRDIDPDVAFAASRALRILKAHKSS